jgi:hypothetical protein
MSCHRPSILGTRNLVLSAQYLVFACMLHAFTSGCRPSNLGTVVEPSFSVQLAAVKAGHSEAIHTVSWRVSDDELAAVSDATALRTLLIDQPQSQITATGVKNLAGLPKLEHLRLRGPGVDDDALVEIAKIASLQILNLPHGQFSDEGLKSLASLPALEQFRFKSAAVTDAGMVTLAEFPALKRLHLIDVPITDDGLKTLAGMKQLESLYIDGAHLSDGAIEELLGARPELHVHLNQQHHDRDPHKHP